MLTQWVEVGYVGVVQFLRRTCVFNERAQPPLGRMVQVQCAIPRSCLKLFKFLHVHVHVYYVPTQCEQDIMSLVFITISMVYQNQNYLVLLLPMFV